MVKGYAIERDRYVVVEDEELKRLKVESTKVIDIERFVDLGEIDRLYWEEPTTSPERQAGAGAFRGDPRGHDRRE